MIEYRVHYTQRTHGKSMCPLCVDICMCSMDMCLYQVNMCPCMVGNGCVMGECVSVCLCMGSVIKGPAIQIHTAGL